MACEQRHNVVCERARARACAHASTITKRMSARKHRKKNARAHARTHRTPAAHKHARAHPAAHKHARAHTIAGTVSSPTTDRARAPRRFGHRAAAAASAPAPSPHHGRVGPRAAVPGPPAWARPGPRDLGGSRPGPGHGPRPARACPLAIIADACWHCDSDHRDSDLRLGRRSPCTDTINHVAIVRVLVGARLHILKPELQKGDATSTMSFKFSGHGGPVVGETPIKFSSFRRGTPSSSGLLRIVFGAEVSTDVRIECSAESCLCDGSFTPCAVYTSQL